MFQPERKKKKEKVETDVKLFSNLLSDHHKKEQLFSSVTLGILS